MNATTTKTTKTTAKKAPARKASAAKKDPMARKTRAKATPAKKPEAAKPQAKVEAKPVVKYEPGEREAKGILAAFVEYFRFVEGATLSEVEDSIISGDWTPPKSQLFASEAQKRTYIRGYLSHAKSKGYIVPVE